MVSYKKQIIFLVISVLICIALTVSIFIQVRKNAIREMNDRQMIYARLAANGIESFLNHHIALLHAMARSQRIILMNTEGKALLRSTQNPSQPHIRGITRMNAQGDILDTVPSVPGAVGANISGQTHVREVLQTKQTVVSDVFRTVQGFDSIAIHVPVYRGKTFDGTIAFLISFSDLADDYLNSLYVPDNRYALLVNAHGRIIHCPTSIHQGRSFLEFYADDSEAAAMFQRMMKGQEGEATFIDHHLKNGAKDTRPKHAVFAPIRVGNGYWSVAVVSSERLMLPAAQTTRYQIMLLALALILFFAMTVYVVARIRGASIEAQKRQKIENDLIKSAEEINDLYHNAPCGYHSLDAQSNIVRINDMELSWLGYAREELIGKSYTQIISEADRGRFEKAFDVLKQQGLVRDVEYDMKRRDGTTFPVLVTASAVTDPEGTFIMSRSMVMDITLRRRQDERLRESEALYRTALETTSDGISIVQHRKYVYANKKLMETIGRPDESLIGKTAGIFIHPDDRRLLAENYLATVNNEPVPHSRYELRILKPDDSMAYVDVTNVTITYHGEPATLAFITDITEHKKYDTALRESEALYRTALESTSDGVTILQNGIYVYVNQKFLNTLGVARDAIINRPLGVLAGSEAQAGLQDFLDRHARQGTQLQDEHITRVLKADGSFIYLQSSSVDIIYRGKPAIITFIRDITESKKAEEALRESETLYRTALETTNDGVTILQDGKYVYVNRKFLDTIGASEDFLTRKKPLGYLIHPDDRAMIREDYQKRLHGESTPGRHELRIIRPDQSIIYLLSTSVDITYRGKPALLSFVQDITKRKKTEEALRESEALYRTALESTSDGITITDVKEGKYLYINQKLMTTLGRPGESIIGGPADIYVHPDDIGLGRKYYQERKKEGKIASYYESRVLKRDGSTAMINVTATDIIFQGRQAVLSFIQDITEKKQKEQALQESEALYRTALEKTNDGISIIQNGKYVYANRKLLKTIGREESGIVGLPLGVFTHPDDRELIRQRYLDRLAGKPVSPSYDFRVIKPDGSVIIISISVVNIIYQGSPATLSFIMDITERRRAEEALRRSEERYRSIIENIDDDYFEADLQGRMTYLNKPRGWSGHSRDELLGHTNKRYTSQEMNEKIAGAFKKLYEDGKPARIVDYEIIRQDGSIAHLEMSVSLMRNAEGEAIGFRGISRDVTERFRMEEERKKLTDQLYQAQKMEAIGTLAGGIAHDFNNLLMGIQGYTSLLLLEIDATHPYYEQLKAVQTLVQSGANLTRQLLGFARAGRYEVVPTNLNDLISKSINLFGRTRKEIRIYEKYIDNIWTAEVDRGQIEQVLLNLFVNAWQAMQGGGSLYLETDNVILDKPLAEIYNLKPGRYVKASITDTGVGMDEKTRQRIFDPFFTTKEMGRGTGLGLASAYGIIKGHSGMITVYSEKGHGTTFNIYLPASSRTVDVEEPKEAELSGGRETILLVDDEEVITDVTGKLLAELGYAIIKANSGEEAVNIYARKHADIDLVIIDMIMPGMSGSDTFDRLKTVNPSVRAILSSGYSLNGNAQAIMNKGVRAFLQKPYRLHDLAQKIRQALAD
ncbi:MAG: PAS domain S-box protein [Deltaproteobacteria bacterium]